MREEWKTDIRSNPPPVNPARKFAYQRQPNIYTYGTSLEGGYPAPSSRGLTHADTHQLDSISSLTMATKARRLQSPNAPVSKPRVPTASGGNPSFEISERRQVGDAQEMMDDMGGRTVRGPDGRTQKLGQPWWKNVGMDEGL